MRLLVVCAVDAERACCDGMHHTRAIAGGVGRTNAAAATTRALIEEGPFEAVLSVGVAGSLPGIEPALDPGALVIGSESVYHEEGLLAPEGFRDMTGLGFPLGPFEGNRIPADPGLLGSLRPLGTCGPIATVASCSGTDDAALEVRRRTTALVEAMEGAAVLHAALLQGVPAIELRAVSNTTGDRDQQVWDLSAAFEALATALPLVEARLLDA